MIRTLYSNGFGESAPSECESHKRFGNGFWGDRIRDTVSTGKSHHMNVYYFFIRTCNTLTTKGIHNCRSTYTSVVHSSYMSHTGWCNSSTHCKSNTNTTYDDPVHPDYRTAYLCALHVWSMTSRTTITGNVLASAKLPWAAAIIRNDCTENQTTCCSSARTNHR